MFIDEQFGPVGHILNKVTRLSWLELGLIFVCDFFGLSFTCLDNFPCLDKSVTKLQALLIWAGLDGAFYNLIQ